jgi:hypothetical protein
VAKTKEVKMKTTFQEAGQLVNEMAAGYHDETIPLIRMSHMQNGRVPAVSVKSAEPQVPQYWASGGFSWWLPQSLIYHVRPQ